MRISFTMFTSSEYVNNHFNHFMISQTRFSLTNGQMVKNITSHKPYNLISIFPIIKTSFAKLGPLRRQFTHFWQISYFLPPENTRKPNFFQCQSQQRNCSMTGSIKLYTVRSDTKCLLADFSWINSTDYCMKTKKQWKCYWKMIFPEFSILPICLSLDFSQSMTYFVCKLSQSAFTYSKSTNNKISEFVKSVWKINDKETPERRKWRRSSVFIVNFEHILYVVLVFPLLILNK